MKTLREHLKESFDKNLRKKYGGDLDFKEVEGGTGYNWIYEAMKAAISEACREQREVCARAIWPEEIESNTEHYILTASEGLIKNAPEPKMI